MEEGKEINIRSEENGKYKKVIFLDVDGVLTTYQSYDLVVDEPMVQRLKKIIDATDAKVVMSSSRRLVYTWFREDSEELGGPSSKWRKEMTHLQEMFDKYGIEISDVTSLFADNSGYRARPCQIREWLVDKPNITNFVILDDDTWCWEWLMPYRIRTRRNRPDGNRKETYHERYIFGLQDEDVEKAIAILNKKK